MADNLGSIGSVSVDITGNDKSYQETVASLPLTAEQKIGQVEQRLRAASQRMRLAMKGLTSDGTMGYALQEDADKTVALTAALAALQAKLASVGIAKQNLNNATKQSISALEMESAVVIKASNATARFAATGDAAAGGVEKVGKRGQSSALGLLMLSQAIEDAQYGFKAIVNNIPGIVMAFGGGAGLAGVLSIAAVGVNQLIQHWDYLKNTFGADTEIGAAIRQVEEFGKALGFSSDESERLKKAEEARKGAAKSVGDIKGAEAAELGGGVHDAVAAAGGGNKAIEILMEKRKKQGETFDDKTYKLAYETYAKMIQDAIDGNAEALTSLYAQAKGTSLAHKLEENSPGHKASLEQTDREMKAAEAESERLRGIADEKREQFQKRASDVADQQGPRLQLAILNKEDMSGEKRLISGRLGRSGTDKETADAIADEAVKSAVVKLETALRERVTSGKSDDMAGARREMAAAARVEEAKNADTKKAEAKALLGKEFKPQIMGVSSYLDKLQTSGVQDKTEETKALEENAKLLKESHGTLKQIATNTSNTRLRDARYGKRGAS
jgi:hypothetical protein